MGLEWVLEDMVKEKIAGEKLSAEKRGWLTAVLKRGQLLESCPGVIETETETESRENLERSRERQRVEEERQREQRGRAESDDVAS